ncbi:MAG: hydroxymethylbilane synthase [Caldilineae bacterium]|nr:MAG: hydroxymethylbilane synthase [Caldilineae bacterium]
MSKTEFVIGTRKSALARWQTDHVRELILAARPDVVCRIEPFTTRGDRTLDRPLPEIGGKGLFTLEIEEALRRGDIDMAVHSLKDLPVEDGTDLTLGAIVGRADVRDVLIAREKWTLETIPSGARIGTSSLRRQAQLLARRPDLQVRPIRGNVDTRIRKVQEGEYDAAVLAAAGVTRLGLTEYVCEWLSLDVMLPAPGQGALAVQCRANDEHTLALLAAVDCGDVRRCVQAERGFLRALAAGCSTPVAAYATVASSGFVHLEALVAAPDGSRVLRLAGEGRDGRELGKRLARQALERGAKEILSHG